MSNSHISALTTAITNKISTIVNSHNSSNDAHSSLFAAKSDTDHVHSQYLTSHQDVSSKLEKTSQTMLGSQSWTNLQSSSVRKDSWEAYDYNQNTISQLQIDDVSIAYNNYEGYVKYTNMYSQPVKLILTQESQSASFYVCNNQGASVEQLEYDSPCEFILRQNDTLYLVADANAFMYYVVMYDSNKINTIADAIYPVGSIYMSVNDVPPSLLFGGTWEQLKDRFLIGAGDTYSAGSTGGSADAVVVKHNHTQNPHNHTQNKHKHSIGSLARYNISSGSGAAAVGNGYGNTQNYTTSEITPTNNETTATNKEEGVDGTGKNMPPYLTVWMWKRTA